MTDQDKDKPGGKRIRLCGYFTREMVDEIRETVEGLPFGATLSGFLETAVRREIDRVKAEGIYQPPRHPKK